MHKLPTITGKELISFLESLGFRVVRIRGSHVRLKNNEGKATTVPLQSSKIIPKGLLRKIIKEDLGMSVDDFMEKFENFRG